LARRRMSATTIAAPETGADARTTLFLCGDVMTGRGIHQILGCPSTPEILESHIRDAREYVRLAERASGGIPRSVDPAHVWGDALQELRAGIHYRMHPPA
jgi:poly-gamma-glutamate capsule biosynthesis protein CapA/YwtB (metallophosphatase superfamily)